MSQTVVLAGKEYELRYELRDRRDIEKKLGKGLMDAICDGEIESMATVVWAGLRHKARRLTVEEVIDLFQKHQDDGGEYDSISRPVFRAIFEAKLFGKAVGGDALELLLDRLIGRGEVEEGKDRPTAKA